MFKNISLYSKLALLLTAMVTILALGCSSSSDSSSPSAPAQPQAPAAAAAAEAAAPAADALPPKPAAKGFAQVAATAAAEPPDDPPGTRFLLRPMVDDNKILSVAPTQSKSSMFITKASCAIPFQTVTSPVSFQYI